MPTESFLGLFDWISISESLKKQTHEQVIFSDGLDRLECPIATIGGHDICGWGTPMQVFRTFVMKAHLGAAIVLALLLPYQVFITKKGGRHHKLVGKYTTILLFIQAFFGIASLMLQAVRYYSVKDKQGLPPEYGYVLPVMCKFAFLPMFAMGFVTPIMNGLGYWVFKIPYKVCAMITFLALCYELGYAYPVMIKRMMGYSTDTYEFQILFELVCISVVYPLQDIANLVIYYDYFFKGGKKFNGLKHHSNNAKMLTVVAFTAICWFSVHYRVEDEETGEQWPFPTFYRLVGSFLPFMSMVATGSFFEYLEFFFGDGGEKAMKKE